MKITKSKDSNRRSGHCSLQLEGDMTIYNAAAFKEDLLAYVDDFKEFKLDMSAVSEIDTAGIQLLLQLESKAQEAERTIQLLGCNEEICELLDLYHLNGWLAPADGAGSTVGGA